MITSITKAYHLERWFRPRKSSRFSASKPARDSSRIMPKEPSVMIVYAIT